MRAAGLAVPALLLATALGVAWTAGLPPTPRHGAAWEDGEDREADRALAFGHLIDSPRPLEVIDQGIEIAEKLRRIYGIDTGDVLRDRREAAEKAREELLEKMSVGTREIEAMSKSLGYSLDPAVCADYCENIRRLALVEVQKSALRAVAAGRQVASLQRE